MKDITEFFNELEQNRDEKKFRESEALNHNYNETNNLLAEVQDKLHSENRVDSLDELKKLKDLIIEYISILKSIPIKVQEKAHFAETQPLLIRNKEFNLKAISTLELYLKVTEGCLNPL